MCRYAIYGPYKDIYACFECRKVYKQTSSSELSKEENEARQFKCPQCGKQMNSMGHDFKAPKKDVIKQWKKVEILFRQGITYHSCGCGGPGYRPSKLNEVDEFLENRYESNDGIRLLKQIGKYRDTNKRRKYRLAKV